MVSPNLISLGIRHDIYPARGRKLQLYSFNGLEQVVDSPRYLPRKGTETLIVIII